MRSIAPDCRDAWRSLRQAPGFAAAVVTSLAIGMAVTIAALALLNATMIMPFPGVTDQDGLVRVSVSRTCGRPDCRVRMSTASDYAVLRTALDGVEDLAAYAHGEVATAVPDARTMRSVIASADYFEVLGVRVALGRFFDANDERAHAAVAVLAHHAWLRDFAGDPSAIGRTIRVANEFVQIAGVAPPHFIGIDRVRPDDVAPELWLPIWIADRVLPPSAAERARGERDLAFVGRARAGVGLDQLRAQAAVAARRLADTRGLGETGIAEVDRVWRVRPRSWQFGLIIVLPIPMLVLAIACVNAANLMLARGSQRRREMAIRLAIGAGRARIARQLLIESAMLTTASTAVALPLAAFGLRFASELAGGPIPFDRVVLASAIAAAAFTTIVFGLGPAIRASAEQPTRALGWGGGGRDATPSQSRMRRGLLMAQVALALGLLTTAWQLVSTVRAQAVSSGTPPEQLLIARFDLRPFALPPHDVDAFYRNVIAGAERLPGVQAAGAARYSAVWSLGQRGGPGPMKVWYLDDEADRERRMSGGYAAGNLFEAAGLRLIAGRDFAGIDRGGQPRTAVVNRTVAEQLGGSAVGATIRITTADRDYQHATDVRIIGVVEAATEPRSSQDGAPPPRVYLPSPLETEEALAVYVRTQGAASLSAQAVRELVARIAPHIPIAAMGTLAEINERSFAQPLWLARAAAVLGVVGLLLASGGLYGVSSYVVAMRSREIAIRMAIGARPSAIQAMILGQAIRVAVVGLIAGGLGSIAVSRVIQSEYHGITGLDVGAFAAASALFLLAMLAASALPARRASRLDPIENLRDA